MFLEPNNWRVVQHSTRSARVTPTTPPGNTIHSHLRLSVSLLKSWTPRSLSQKRSEESLASGDRSQLICGIPSTLIVVMSLLSILCIVDCWKCSSEWDWSGWRSDVEICGNSLAVHLCCHCLPSIVVVVSFSTVINSWVTACPLTFWLILYWSLCWRSCPCESERYKWGTYCHGLDCYVGSISLLSSFVLVLLLQQLSPVIFSQ